VSLHEQFDRELGAISPPPPPAPVEETMRRGTWMRRRRHATAVACTAAVVAAAIWVPLAVHWKDSSAPETSHYTVTVQPPGPTAPVNEIAYGTVNGKAWRILMGKTSPNDASFDSCAEMLGPAFEPEPVTGPDTGCYPPRGATLANPVAFDPPAFAVGPDPQALGLAGEVAANVTHVTVTLTNGTLLTLQPVTVYGDRYVAFAAPTGAVVQVTAYSRRGEIARAFPFAPDGPDWFLDTGWLRPGQHELAPVTAVVGSGRYTGGTGLFQGSWSVVLQQGPWGVCETLTGEDGLCGPGQPGPRRAGAQVVYKNGRYEICEGLTPLDVTRVVLTLPGSGSVTVQLAGGADAKYWAFGYTKAFSWTAYNAADLVVGSGRTSQP
jgi:hypothetical protein